MPQQLKIYFLRNRLPLFFIFQALVFGVFYFFFLEVSDTFINIGRPGVEVFSVNGYHWFVFIYSIFIAVLGIWCIVTAFRVLSSILDKKSHWAWILILLISFFLSIKTKAGFFFYFPFVFGNGLIW